MTSLYNTERERTTVEVLTYLPSKNFKIFIKRCKIRRFISNFCVIKFLLYISVEYTVSVNWIHFIYEGVVWVAVIIKFLIIVINSLATVRSITASHSLTYWLHVAKNCDESLNSRSISDSPESNESSVTPIHT